MEPQPPAPGGEVPPGPPAPEPVVGSASPIAPGADEQHASDPGRIARARRSAAELETRARREFDRARDEHVTVRLAVQAFESDRRRAGGLLAGGLAYRIFLWQIPLALFLVSAFGLATQLSGDDPADLARETGMTAALAGTISQAVAASQSARWWLLLLGAVLTVWAGRGVYRGARLISELAWETRAPRGSSLKGSLAVTGFGLLAVAMQAFLPKVSESLDVPGLIRFVLGLILASSLAFAVLWLLPRADAPWTSIVPGAVLTGVGMRLLGLAVSTYFASRLDHSNDLYGALGLAVVMMLFLFLVARIFVAAQFLNATLIAAESRARTPGDSAALGRRDQCRDHHPEAGAADHVVREMCPDVHATEPHRPHDAGQEWSRGLGKLLGGDEGERGGDGGVARDPAEVALDALADRDVGQDPLRAGPAAEGFDELGADPRDRAADGQARGQALTSGEQREDRDHRNGAERPGLHDGADRGSNLVARAVDRPEEAFLVAWELESPGLGEADEEQDRAESEPGDPSSPHVAFRSGATRSCDCGPGPISR